MSNFVNGSGGQSESEKTAEAVQRIMHFVATRG
jgi:hypothetical protein